MKKLVLFIIVLSSFILNNQIFCYNTYFTSPTNGQIFGLTSSGNTYAINVGWYQEGEKTGYYYYSKLFTHEGEYSSRNNGTIPQWFYLGIGSYSWRIEMWEGNILGEEYKVAEQSITFYVKYIVYASNNFGSGYINLENSQVSSGSSVTKFISESVSVGAIDQNDGMGYYRIWNTNGSNISNWSRNYSPIFGATSRDFAYSVVSGDNGITLTAELKKVCDLTFQAGSSMYINGSSRSSGWTESVVEQNAITAYANGYTSNGLDYSFTNWTSGGQSFSSSITATVHKTYTANYSAKPTNSGKYASCGGNVNNPIIITWTDNINSAVDQYEIRRKVKHNGVWGSVVSLTTVGRGVQSYTDNDYVWTNGYTDDLLQYDVREYYGSAYSDEDWVTAYGRENANIQAQNGLLLNNAKEIPDEYSISNFPNPFNPTTTISYQLPQSGFVTIKVYDMIGKEVAMLVNNVKSAGYHSVNFDASKLTSGVYIYTINANNFVQSKKMILVK